MAADKLYQALGYREPMKSPEGRPCVSQLSVVLGAGLPWAFFFLELTIFLWQSGEAGRHNRFFHCAAERHPLLGRGSSRALFHLHGVAIAGHIASLGSTRALALGGQPISLYALSIRSWKAHEKPSTVNCKLLIQFNCELSIHFDCPLSSIVNCELCICALNRQVFQLNSLT